MDQRKVGLHHLAFYRGWLQGLPLDDLGDRYLETGIDLRRTKTTLGWIRDVVRQAALRNGKHGTARLLRLRIQVAVSSNLSDAKKIPSLADFREEIDPDGSFYTEKELIQIYTEQYPQSVDSKARQRQNLVARQLKALSWVESLLATKPVPDDLVSAWFDPKISGRLILAGIPNLRGLSDRIRDRGYRWWVTVPGLGEKGAARITRWLHTYEDSLGSIPKQITVPSRQSVALIDRRQMETGIVPIESLLVPSELNGASGSNRYPGIPRIGARDDMGAIQSWLNTKSASKSTQAAYRKETERLLLWAIMEKGKALSDLSVDDCTSYRDWLSMIGRTDADKWTFRIPQDGWIKKTGINNGRNNSCWRPFATSLSAKSVKQAILILSGLFGWLTQVQYLSFNPWAAVSMTLATNKDEAPDLELTRAFTKGQWAHLIDYLAGLPETQKTRQLGFLLQFAYTTGMRRSELSSARTGHLYSMPLQDRLGSRWMLKVLGKGGKWRSAPIPDQLMETLGNYLAFRGLNHDPSGNPPDTPLIARQNGKLPLTDSMLYKALRGLFAEVAQNLEGHGKTSESKVFRKASTHWLRHTRGSHLGSSGMPATMIQKLLGHASVATTSIYTRTDDEQLWAEISKA